ncbi:MAG: hypothetical protein ABIT01_07080 [Thermoanaerobaculia bacterium]
MIAFLFVAACVVFVLSLPLSSTPFGGRLRRWALILFLLALAPSVLLGLLNKMAPSSTGAGTPAPDPLSAALGLLILAPLAYGALRLRQAMKPKGRDAWGEFMDRKAAGKKLVDPKAPKGGGPPDPFDPFGGRP